MSRIIIKPSRSLRSMPSRGPLEHVFGRKNRRHKKCQEPQKNRKLYKTHLNSYLYELFRRGSCGDVSLFLCGRATVFRTPVRGRMIGIHSFLGKNRRLFRCPGGGGGIWGTFIGTRGDARSRIWRPICIVAYERSVEFFTTRPPTFRTGVLRPLADIKSVTPVIYWS